MIEDLIKSLHLQFSLKDLGELSYFLGVEVSRLSNGGMFLSQRKYIMDLLSKTKMQNANAISTPMVSGSILSAIGGDKMVEVRLYRSTEELLEHYSMSLSHDLRLPTA